MTGKPANQASSYRPVSLLPAFAKLLKSLVCKWLPSFAEKNKLIPEHQYGFRKIFSTADPLARLVGDIAISKSSDHTLTNKLIMTVTTGLMIKFKHMIS